MFNIQRKCNISTFPFLFADVLDKAASMSEADVTEIVFRWITDEVNWPDNVCYKIAEKVSRIVYEKVSRKQFLLIKNYTKCFLFIRYCILFNHFPNLTPYLSITIVVKVGQTLNCLLPSSL